MPIPDEPYTDYFIESIINVFSLLNRGRRYASGLAVAPLPLSVGDITDVVYAHPTAISREILDTCIFGLDDIWLKDYNDKSSNPDSRD